MTKQVRPLKQPARNKEAAADIAELRTQMVEKPAAPANPRVDSSASVMSCVAAGATHGCQQRITLSLFFDGTGNNLNADVPTDEHSNVARLFRAHPDDDGIRQVHVRYIPGLGTYFNEIGDPGGTTLGASSGAYGQERLDWAFKELTRLLKAAENRALSNNSRIVEVRLAVFGFSRGAASARAFCRDLQKSCVGQRGSYKVRPGAMGGSGIALKGGYPIEVYFLGIFDTVASVGVPMAANNIAAARRNQNTWRGAGGIGAENLSSLAFGELGADPSPGVADGHGDWADDLKIADVVSRCAHLVAGHEMRNSFPVDSALDGMGYPPGVTEMVLPGVHSDVGGGYRPDESGRSAMLARVPLRIMLDLAVKAGVPLFNLAQIQRLPPDVRRDFALDDAGAKDYAAMQDLWERYMASISNGRPIGAVVLSHMKQYWRYRLTVAVERASVAKSGGTARTPEQQRIANNERQFAKERAALETDAAEKKTAHAVVRAKLYSAQEALTAAQTGAGFQNQVPMWKAQVASLEDELAEKYDNWRSAQAKVDWAANDSKLLESLDNYDAWLLQDAEWLHFQHQRAPTRRMRPHYQAVLDAYTEVVKNKQPLSPQSDLYKFFSTYVHDSLAGFAKDNTRPSDPRVIYIGSDTKLRYASIDTRSHERAVA